MPPDRLFKYTTTNAATAILGNQTLRWGSPASFNDPFDLKNYFYVDFSWSDIRQEALRDLAEILLSPDEPTLAVGNEFVPNIKSLRTTMKGLSPVYVKFVLDAGFDDTFKLCEKIIAEDRNFWLEEREAVRILCFAERADKLLMWSHYAEQDAGVVLEFETKSLERSASSHAIMVRYSNIVPTPFTYQEILDWLVGKKEFPDVSDYTLTVASSKSTDWNYEQEWRFLKYADPPAPGLYSDFAFPSEALIGVYFGSRINSAKRDDLFALLKGKYPHVRIFDMREKDGRYELEFVPA